MKTRLRSSAELLARYQRIARRAARADYGRTTVEIGAFSAVEKPQ